MPLLSIIGKYFLVIYLVHPLLYKPIMAFLLPITRRLDTSVASQAWLYSVLAFASVAIVTAVSLAVAFTTARFAVVRQMVTPRDWNDWLPVARWKRTGVGLTGNQFSSRKTASAHLPKND